MLITPGQIKAARAMLDWSAEDLGKRVGVVKTTISAIETGRSNGSVEILEAIYNAFTAHGMDFVDGGVVPRHVSSYVLNSYLDLLDDIAHSLPEGGEVLKHCVDDRRSTPEVIEKIAAMRRNGVRERLTISAENSFITGDPKFYRQIPVEYFASSEVIIIYSNKVAFFVDGKALVIISNGLAKVFRDQFEYWWKEGKVLNVT